MYSRKLEDVTDALPDVVETLNRATPHDVILDGEVIAIKDGRPLPFQTVLRRFRRKYDIEAMQKEFRMQPYVFDILYIDGKTLIDIPLQERRKHLEAALTECIAPQTVSSDVAVIEAFYKESLDAGHEGLMLKVLSSSYTPGIRGKNWLKIKPGVDTMDLAVIGAEWGEGEESTSLRFIPARLPERGGVTPSRKGGDRFHGRAARRGLRGTQGPRYRRVREGSTYRTFPRLRSGLLRDPEEPQLQERVCAEIPPFHQGQG